MAVNAENPDGDTTEKINQPFLKGSKPVILLGRLFGIISRTDVISTQKQKRKINIASIYSVCLATFITVNAILLLIMSVEHFQKDPTTLVKLQGFHHTVYAISMWFVFCYQCFASSKLRAIVQNLLTFKDTQIAHKRFTSFPKFCYLVTLTCLFLGITENTIFDYQFLAMGKKRKPEASILEVSYINYFQHWHVILPVYNPVATVILMILIKIGTWGWIHIDTICIILCRALWEKLKRIEEMVESTLSPDSANVVELERVLCTELFETNQKSRQPVSSAQRIWDSYQEEYEKLSQLVEQVESYICPLILACFAGNIYIVVILLFNWIGPLSGSQSSKEQFIRVWFSFFQYSFRVAAITHFAGEVHQQSARILRQIQKCPQSVYSVSVERLERMLVGNPTGISLMGSFYITRKYFISIISFIFTTEIVLLQTYSSYYASAKENDS